MPILSQPPRRRDGTAEAVVEETERAQVLEELGSACTAWRPPSDLTVPIPSPTLAPPCSGEDPPVSGKGVPRRRLPQDDGREIDHLWQVRAHGKTPQDRLRIDQTGRRRHLARGTVGADHEVGMQRFAGAQPVAVDPPVLFQWLVCPADEGCGSRLDRGVVEHGVEDRPR